MNKKIIIGVIVALIVGLVVGYMVHPSAVAQQVKGITNTSGISAAYSKIGTGCDNGFGTCVGVVTYGGLLSTTTPASMTLAPTDMQYGMISMNPTVGAITVTLPATTTSGMSSFLPNAGDNTSFMIQNASSTSGANITFAAGTGTLLQAATSTLTLLPLKGSTMDCMRKVNTDILCMFNPAI